MLVKQFDFLKPLRACALILLTSVISLVAARAFANDAKKSSDKTSDEQNYPYYQYGFSSRPKGASSEGEKRAKSKKKVVKKAPAAKQPPAPLIEQASTELLIKPEDRSQNVLESPATVRSQVQEVPSPLHRASFEIGLSVQSYQPRGRVQLQGVDSTDLGEVGSRPMPSLELRWMPVHFGEVAQWDLGAFGSVGYVQHDLDILAPTGVSIPGSKLNTYKTQAGFSGAWHLNPLANWGLRAQLGAGQINAVQTSSSSYANASSSVSFLSAGLFLDYRVWERLSVFLGYDYRRPSSGEGEDLRVPRDNFMVGVSGGFQ